MPYITGTDTHLTRPEYRGWSCVRRRDVRKATQHLSLPRKDGKGELRGCSSAVAMTSGQFDATGNYTSANLPSAPRSRYERPCLFRRSAGRPTLSTKCTASTASQLCQTDRCAWPINALASSRGGRGGPPSPTSDKRVAASKRHSGVSSVASLHCCPCKALLASSLAL